MKIRLFLFCLFYALPAFAEPPSWQTVINYTLQSGERIWQKTQSRAEDLSSRDIFRYALVLCEADQNLDRLPLLFEVAHQMQEHDPQSRGYGNFYWRWAENSVKDYNAVEFCMQSAALIWLRHQQKLPASAKTTLKDILDLAIEGCLRHGVRESYTNIAFMNAGNLILLGESFNRPLVAQEGYRRLELATLYTYQYGTHEYVSPTYYGVDLESLSIIERFATHTKARQLAHTLLRLLWTDIALNWYPPAQKLAGAHSRTYDYLRGLGHLDTALWVEGWLTGPPRGGTNAIYPALASFHPDDEIRALSHQYPRLIHQRWDASASRTHYVLPHVTLSTSTAAYGNQDMPLTFDFAGARESVRGYFIADARHDPYGKIRITAGNHRKALHLKPYWRATQRSQDALGIVVYREDQLPDTFSTLESHIVMPQDVDEIWVGDRRVYITPTKPLNIALASTEALVLRKGSAAVGIRLPWARNRNGEKASTSLVFDQNTYGALRLTTTHHVSASQNLNAGAAFWIRVVDDLDTDTFTTWRKQFAFAATTTHLHNDQLSVSIAGKEGPLSISVPLSHSHGSQLSPEPADAILAYNGQDLGRQAFERLDWFVDRARQDALKPIPVQTATYFEAEQGRVILPMVSETDTLASSKTYVWMPGPEGRRGGSDLGAITWQLVIPEDQTYYLWARIIAPTPEDDSFYVRAYTTQEEILPRSDWHIARSKTWVWVPIRLNRSPVHTPILLPKGNLNLEFRVREDGAKIDRLYISPNADEPPQDIPSHLKSNTDFNGDGHTDFVDFLYFTHTFGTQEGMPQYQTKTDLDSNGRIDFSDFVLFVNQFASLIS